KHRSRTNHGSRASGASHLIHGKFAARHQRSVHDRYGHQDALCWTRLVLLNKAFTKKIPDLSISGRVVRFLSRALVWLLRKPASAKSDEYLRSISMRVMVVVKANKDSEAGVLPDKKILTEMGKFNEELVKAGIMLAGEGLQASSKGKRVRFLG